MEEKVVIQVLCYAPTVLAVIVVRRLFWPNAVNFNLFRKSSSKRGPTVTKEYEMWRAPVAAWDISY